MIPLRDPAYVSIIETRVMEVRGQRVEVRFRHASPRPPADDRVTSWAARVAWAIVRAEKDIEKAARAMRDRHREEE